MYRLLVISLILSATYCTPDEESELTQTVVLGNGDELSIPEDCTYRQIQGIDTFAGEIVGPNESSFYIFMDIGKLAGSYVDAERGAVKIGKSRNERFLYQKRETQYLSDHDCCYYFTFEDRGPANFVAADNEHIDLVFDIMTTYESQ